MKGQNYRTLVEEQAHLAGADPEESWSEFVALVRQIQEHTNEGTALQRRLEELSPQFAFYRKGEALPEGVELLNEDQLRISYANLRKRQRHENGCVVVLTRTANRMLGGEYLHIPRSKAGNRA